MTTRLVLTDPELDQWVEKNGPVAPGYSEFKAWLYQCGLDHDAMLEALKEKLASADAPKLYFVPGVGLSDCPF